MANPKDNTVLSHLSLFAGFCHPPTDTHCPDQMRDGTPRNPHRDGNINAITQAEFDALPTWSDIEDDPDYNRQQPRDAPPRYSVCVESCLTPLLPRVSLVETDDDGDDSTCGFGGERVPAYNSILTSSPVFRGQSTETYERKRREGNRGDWTLCCFWMAVGVGMLATIGVAFAIDVGASEYGYGTGVAKSMVQGMRELRFCLSPPDRSAPGPQTWRYMVPVSPTSCSPHILTLTVRPADPWPLQLAHEAATHNPRTLERSPEKQRHGTPAALIRAPESGDDLAEEGVLGQGRWDTGTRHG